MSDFHYRQSLSAEDLIFTSPIPMWCKDYSPDAQARMLWVTPSYETVFKVTSDEYVGKSDFDVWPADVAQSFRQNDLKAIELGVMETIEEVPGNLGAWGKVKVTKWCERTTHFGRDYLFVYGHCVPYE